MVIGAIVVWTAPWNIRAGPLIGYYLVASFGAPYVLLLTIAASNTLGATKKATISGAIFIGYNAGNIAAAYLVFNEEKPVKYRSTWISVIVAMVFASLGSLFLRWFYIRANAKRDAAQGLGPGVEIDGDTAEKLASGGMPVLERLERYEDLTEKQRPEFRYTL